MAKEHVKRITSIGGQALIEGVMMRGPKKTSMAVRLPDGSIDLTELSTPSLRQKYAFWRVPVLRGIATFVDSLRAGFQALSLSAEKSGIDEEEGEPSKFDLWLEKKFGDKIMNAIMAAGTVLGVLLAVVLFFFLPTLLYNGVELLAGSTIEPFRSLAEGVMQMSGRCGDRQLGVMPGTKLPEFMIISDNGGYYNSNETMILERG